MMQPPDNSTSITEHLQPSVLVIVLRILAIIFMLDAIYTVLIVGFLALSNAHDWHTPYIGLLMVANLAKYALLSWAVIKMFSDWAGRAYYLTGHHLIQRLGILNITDTTFELTQLRSITIKQGWLGRRFNFGTIHLIFVAYGNQQSVTLREINSPYRYKSYFSNYLDHYLKGEVR